MCVAYVRVERVCMCVCGVCVRRVRVCVSVRHSYKRGELKIKTIGKYGRAPSATYCMAM